jgi:N-carbamoyl-L-amino-acid hydrolase
MSGSHIDTVPGGGPLDGAYGVLAAIEVARTLQDHKIALPVAFEVAAFLEEEGRFYDLLGSKAVAGQLSWDEIESARDSDGVNLVDALRDCGFDPSGFESARRRDIAAYIELHIEQGPVLEARGVPIGIVDEITGGRQVEYNFKGETGHAGTVPMDLRRDAMMGALTFMAEAREMVLRDGTPGRVRLTFGVVQAAPGFPSRIPSDVKVVQEIRDFDPDLLERLTRESVALATRAAKDARLELDWRELCAAVPAKMAPSVLDHVRASADALDYATLQMPSGAGHDAQVIATIAPAGMIFVPSRGGVSHREDEWTDFALLEKGANVLLQTVLRLIEQHGRH